VRIFSIVSSFTFADRFRVGIMGTSPGTSNTMQLSASHQSSSYLPRKETAYMSDFLCCSTSFANLHDLMKHREENPQAHRPSDTPGRNFNYSNGNGMGSSQLGLAQPFTSPPPIPLITQPTRGPSHAESSRRPQQQLATIVDDDGIDMDMDDISSFNAGAGASQDHSNMLQSVSGAQMSNFAALMGNPTVSSVNTPSIGTQQAAPHDIGGMTGADYTAFDGFDNLDLFSNGIGDLSMFDPNTFHPEMPGLTLHDPASQLSNIPTNGGNRFMPLDRNHPSMQPHQLQGIPTAALFAFPAQEDKKFKCPVRGCDKSYKNQNGLKYHKQVKKKNCFIFAEYSLTSFSTATRINR
jgi:transcription factor SFP1